MKVLGAAKVLLIARFYGTSDALDAYLIAFLIPSFLADVISLATSSALIPAYVETRTQNGIEGAQKLLGNVVFLCMGICAVLVIFICAASNPLLAVAASGFEEQKLALTKELLRIMSVIVVFGGLGAIWKSVLNSMNRFALPAAVTVITPIAIVGTVIGVWLGGGTPDGYTLAFGTVGGSAVECVFVFWKLAKTGISPLPRWSSSDEATTKMIAEYWPVMISSLVAGSSVYANLSMAASLGSGSVAAMNYGTRVLNLALAIGPNAIGTAVLPHFSAMVAGQQSAALRELLGDFRRNVFLFSVPVTAALVLGSTLLVRLLFEHGAFTSADTDQVASVQRLALLQIPFAIISAVLARMISALKANRVLLGGAIASLSVNVILNYLLTPIMGVSGIALATAAAAFVYYCYLSRLLSKRLDVVDDFFQQRNSVSNID